MTALLGISLGADLAAMTDIIVAQDVWESLQDAGPEGVRVRGIQTLTFVAPAGVARVMVSPWLERGTIASVSPLGVSLVEDMKRLASERKGTRV